MRKSTELITDVSGNQQKFNSYREAWTRISEARAQGFYLEAVVIQESIIADRLQSYLLASGWTSKSQKHTSTGDLVKAWRKTLVDKQNGSDVAELALKATNWLYKRNRVTHAIAKTRRDDIAPINDFLALANEAADEGQELARAIDRWVKKNKVVVTHGAEA